VFYGVHKAAMENGEAAPYVGAVQWAAEFLRRGGRPREDEAARPPVSSGAELVPDLKVSHVGWTAFNGLDAFEPV